MCFSSSQAKISERKIAINIVCPNDDLEGVGSEVVPSIRNVRPGSSINDRMHPGGEGVDARW
jgi:hypothetical protein